MGRNTLYLPLAAILIAYGNTEEPSTTLCEQFQSGAKSILTMAPTADKFVILATDYSGFVAPLSQFKLQTKGAFSATLNLAGSPIVNLNFTSASADERRFAFLFSGSAATTWEGLHLAFVSSNRSHIITVPLDNDGGHLGKFQVNRKHMPQANLPFYSMATDASGAANAQADAKRNETYWCELELEAEKVRFGKGAWFVVNLRLVPADGGFFDKQDNFALGFDNNNLTVSYFTATEEPIVVPYKTFFVCKHEEEITSTTSHWMSPSGTIAASSSNLLIVTAIACIVLFVLVMLICLVVYRKSKRAKKTKKSSSKKRKKRKGSKIADGSCLNSALKSGFGKSSKMASRSPVTASNVVSVRTCDTKVSSS